MQSLVFNSPAGEAKWMLYHTHPKKDSIRDLSKKGVLTHTKVYSEMTLFGSERPIGLYTRHGTKANFAKIETCIPSFRNGSTVHKA